MNWKPLLSWIIGTSTILQSGQCNNTHGNSLYYNTNNRYKHNIKEHIYEIKDEEGRLFLLRVIQKKLETSIVSLRIYGGEYQHSTLLQRTNVCHMTGGIVNVSDSFVSLDVCDDISGVLFQGKKVYTLKSGRAFLVYNHQTEVSDYPEEIICNTDSLEHQHVQNMTMIRKNVYSRNTLPLEHGRLRRSKETLIIELFVVIDHALFSEAGIGRNITRAVQYIENVAKHVDEIYSVLDIRVLLVGIEIWSVPQAATPASDATQLLDQFLQYAKTSIHKTAPVKYDFIALISGKTFGNSHVGMAHVNSMCGDQSGAIVQDDKGSLTREIKSAVVLAHEIGHVFGMLHDDAACTCLGPRDCVMAADITQLPTTFSSCSGKHIKKVKQTGSAPCLYNVPNKVYNGPICGNGIKEKGEVCDCGGLKKCKKSLCCTDTCQLKHGAKCNSGGCCDNCQIVKANKLCRPSQNECDLDEVCDGRHAVCSVNRYKQDLSQCGQRSGYCYRGQCRSNTLQCQHIWGISGRAANINCYTINKRGKEGGNCGSISNTGYLSCNESNKMCGMLFCDSSIRHPLIGGGTQKVSSVKFGSVTCKGVALDLGPDVPDPGIVEDGSPCYTNTSAKIKGVCINQICVNLNKIAIKSCPDDQNGTVCSGKGICNNIGACWCNHGYTGLDCSVNISSTGGTTPDKELTVVHIVLISVGGVLFLAGTSVVTIIMCYKERSKGKKKIKETNQQQPKTAWSNTNKTKTRETNQQKEQQPKTAWSNTNKNKKTVVFSKAKIQTILISNSD